MLQQLLRELGARVREWHKEEKPLKMQASQGSSQITSSLTNLEVATELTVAGDGT